MIDVNWFNLDLETLVSNQTIRSIMTSLVIKLFDESRIRWDEEFSQYRWNIYVSKVVICCVMLIDTLAMIRERRFNLNKIVRSKLIGLQWIQLLLQGIACSESFKSIFQWYVGFLKVSRLMKNIAQQLNVTTIACLGSTLKEISTKRTWC